MGANLMKERQEMKNWEKNTVEVNFEIIFMSTGPFMAVIHYRGESNDDNDVYLNR